MVKVETRKLAALRQRCPPKGSADALGAYFPKLPQPPAVLRRCQSLPCKSPCRIERRVITKNVRDKSERPVGKGRSVDRAEVPECHVGSYAGALLADGPDERRMTALRSLSRAAIPRQVEEGAALLLRDDVVGPVCLLRSRFDPLPRLCGLDRRHHELAPQIRIGEDRLDIDAPTCHGSTPNASALLLPTRPRARRAGHIACGCDPPRTQRSSALRRSSGRRRREALGRSGEGQGCRR